MAEINEVCKGCLRWERFKDKCHFWWQDKSECPSKAEREEDLIPIM